MPPTDNSGFIAGRTLNLESKKVPTPHTPEHPHIAIPVETRYVPSKTGRTHTASLVTKLYSPCCGFLQEIPMEVYRDSLRRPEDEEKS